MIKNEDTITYNRSIIINTKIKHGKKEMESRRGGR